MPFVQLGLQPPAQALRSPHSPQSRAGIHARVLTDARRGPAGGGGRDVHCVERWGRCGGGDRPAMLRCVDEVAKGQENRAKGRRGPFLTGWSPRCARRAAGAWCQSARWTGGPSGAALTGLERVPGQNVTNVTCVIFLVSCCSARLQGKHGLVPCHTRRPAPCSACCSSHHQPHPTPSIQGRQQAHAHCRRFTRARNHCRPGCAHGGTTAAAPGSADSHPPQACRQWASFDDCTASCAPATFPWCLWNDSN